MKNINKVQRKTTGEIIKDLRIRKLKLTQKQLAERVHKSQQDIAKIENGNTVLTIDDMVCFADELGVTLDYLCGISTADTTDHDLKFVCDYTGLSVKAVKELHNGTLTEKLDMNGELIIGYSNFLENVLCKFIDFLINEAVNNAESFYSSMFNLISSSDMLLDSCNEYSFLASRDIEKGYTSDDFMTGYNESIFDMLREHQKLMHCEMYELSKFFDRLIENFSIGGSEAEMSYQEFIEKVNKAHALRSKTNSILRGYEDDQT